MTNADEIRWLAAVRAEVCRALEGHDADVWLFGSRARADHRPGSDIDVAIHSTHPLPAGLLARLRETLEESTVPLYVDIVELRTASPELRANVLEEGVRWSGRKSA